jgi:hypothetical protein
MMVSKNKRAATAKTSRHVNLSIGFGDDCRPQSSHFNLLCEPCFPFFLSYYSTRWCYLKSIPQIRNKLDKWRVLDFSYFLFFSFNFFFLGGRFEGSRKGQPNFLRVESCGIWAEKSDGPLFISDNIRKWSHGWVIARWTLYSIKKKEKK